jgi:hypothetical protein
VLLISWASRIAEPNRRLAFIVFMISFGVALTSGAELKFNLVGFIIQACAVVFEASRLVMIEILLHGMKMDPLVSLHYFAPVCALFNLMILPFTEGLAPFYELGRIGPLVLISNALVAFFLNVAAVFLVGVGSGLILTLAGVLKDILLISASVALFSAQVSPMQVFGPSPVPSILFISSYLFTRKQATLSLSQAWSCSRPPAPNRHTSRWHLTPLHLALLLGCCDETRRCPPSALALWWTTNGPGLD